MALTITDDTFTRKPEKGSLRKIFGKVAAVIALGATIAFYALGFNISAAYYNQWQDNKAPAAVTQTWDQHQDKTANLPWGEAAGALGISLAAGFSGIALGKKRNSYGSYGGSSGYYGNNSNDGFFWGYMMGSSNSGSSSSSSSSDNGGAAAAIVIVGAAALAASASVVTYKALKANFGNDGP